MTIWAGSSAVVTGGASGLGAATATALAAAGLKVAIFDLNADAGQAHAAELGGMFQRVDVSDPESVAAGLDAVGQAIGAPRVLVNCAGIGPAAKTVSRGAPHDPAMFAKTIGINLIGSFNCASQAAAGMVAAEPLGPDGARGVIINTASVAAFEGQVGQAAYSASKGGVHAMMLPLAREFAAFGIRVNTIAPGIMLTPMMAGMPEEVQASLAKQVPFPQRLGKPEEYANTVAYIYETTYVNAETIRCDGAIRMQAK